MRMPATVGGLREALAMFPDDTPISCVWVEDSTGCCGNEAIDIDVDESGGGRVSLQFVTYCDED